ncbi:Predicted transcriptional regulator containing the HTH domain [Candidatus Terasakiella magnetica]|uniref:Predicted transcriptional regulator containing the HTH domain n=1 Tax=Candidatus Terasakiella magnetica TaxID=1867952 RepID=A0A1C3RCF4_9PROT|nr:SMC-Scp complex subunit ScpB [Candidatus Terasakiella magnetica]SCA54928.1 Predicted transcriptional regulator containing the HTH domain [Candidatus Terasakiella magnetica]
MSTEEQIQQLRLLEAVLFASKEPLGEKKLSNYFEEGVSIKELLRILQGEYEGRGVNLVQRGNAWAFRTAEDIAEQLSEYRENVKTLSRAAIETLSIVAYHQPVTRAEIEEIRGVSLSKGTLDVLFEAGWIKPRGRRRTPGRPMTWGTTVGFLDQFGLEKTDHLPGIEELKSAGLLDARPAINAYTVRGEMELPLDHPDQQDHDNELLEPLADE